MYTPPKKIKLLATPLRKNRGAVVIKDGRHLREIDDSFGDRRLICNNTSASGMVDPDGKLYIDIR